MNFSRAISNYRSALGALYKIEKDKRELMDREAELNTIVRESLVVLKEALTPEAFEEMKRQEVSAWHS